MESAWCVAICACIPPRTCCRQAHLARRGRGARGESGWVCDRAGDGSGAVAPDSDHACESGCNARTSKPSRCASCAARGECVRDAGRTEICRGHCGDAAAALSHCARWARGMPGAVGARSGATVLVRYRCFAGRVQSELIHGGVCVAASGVADTLAGAALGGFQGIAVGRGTGCRLCARGREGVGASVSE